MVGLEPSLWYAYDAYAQSSLYLSLVIFLSWSLVTKGYWIYGL